MRLVRANVSDCEKIWSMQIEAFADLLAKYQDYETSPGYGLVSSCLALLLAVKDKVDEIHGFSV